MTLFEFVRDWPERASSMFARVEVVRALRRAAAPPALLRRAEHILARIALIRIDEEIISIATEIHQSDLRSLDAIHLATALSLGRDLALFVGYDRRLLDAADRAGLSTASPS